MIPIHDKPFKMFLELFDWTKFYQSSTIYLTEERIHLHKTQRFKNEFFLHLTFVFSLETPWGVLPWQCCYNAPHDGETTICEVSELRGERETLVFKDKMSGVEIQCNSMSSFPLEFSGSSVMRWEENPDKSHRGWPLQRLSTRDFISRTPGRAELCLCASVLMQFWLNVSSGSRRTKTETSFPSSPSVWSGWQAFRLHEAKSLIKLWPSRCQ